MKYFALLFTALIALSTQALAENSDQQNRMVACNKEASGMKGKERKTFMSKCLKKEMTMTQQQEKMARCNKDAAGKSGDERKAFMSQCLKKSN